MRPARLALYVLRALLALLGLGPTPTRASRGAFGPTGRACAPIPRELLRFAAPPPLAPCHAEASPCAPEPMLSRIRLWTRIRAAPPAWLLAPPATLSHAAPPLLERGRCAIARWLVFDSPPDGRPA